MIKLKQFFQERNPVLFTKQLTQSTFLLSIFVLFAAFNFAFGQERSRVVISDLEQRIENFKKLKPADKQRVLKEQNELLKTQMHEMELQEADLRKQRNQMIIQKGDIQKQQKKLASVFEQMGWQKTLLVLLVFLLVLIAVTGWFAFRAYEQKQHYLEQERYQKNRISEQNMILENQKSQNELILKNLQDSIKYALRIQNAILPTGPQLLNKLPGDYFILSKPKDTVSGDFYFVEQKGDWTFIAVADCTGHGVPGAFVSLLGISLLNETIHIDKEPKASEILQKLRDRIITLLQQKERTGDSRDGMDISLLMLNKNRKQAQWSGANNPLFHVSKSTKELTEYKPNKQPVGIYPHMEDFTNHTFAVEKGDVFYLYTDGFIDQFGGSNGKKFMKKQLKELLSEHSSKNISIQKVIVEDALHGWMQVNGKAYEQVDDITLFGFQVE